MSDAPAVKTIARDASCMACGYNLRGLGYDRDCPECGKTIAAWVRADRFQALDPQWIGQLRRGSKLLHLGVIAALPLVYPGLVLATIGLWPMTAAPVHHSETAADRTARLSARWLIGLGLCIGTIAMLIAAVHLISGRGQLFGNWQITDAAMIVAGTLIGLGLASAWLHISQLARRVPDGDLARGFALLRRDWFIAGGIFVAVAIFTNISNALDLSQWVHRVHEAAFALLAGVPLIVTLIWLWWRTLRATDLLRRTVRQWAST